MPNPVKPLPEGQMPRQMGMSPQMSDYRPYNDPNMLQAYPWPGHSGHQLYYDPNMPPQGYPGPGHPSHILPHMVGRSHPPPLQQQTPLPMPPNSGRATKKKYDKQARMIAKQNGAGKKYNKPSKRKDEKRKREQAEKKKLDDEQRVKREAEKAEQRKKDIAKREEWEAEQRGAEQWLASQWEAEQREAATGPADQNSPEHVDREVRSLLNNLTIETFTPVPWDILDWANRSVNESDGRTLIQVIRLVFEKATDDAARSEMYARLCRFLMERISQDVRDERINNTDGKPLGGDNLFHKYLLNRCHEDFERGWSAREAVMRAEAGKSEDGKRRLGLVKFIGELFKAQMLTEKIMHDYIKKLLTYVEINPEDEEIESLCTLLATIGQALDTFKAYKHMDMYFLRMQEVVDSDQISSRIQFMLFDILQLRSKEWMAHMSAEQIKRKIKEDIEELFTHREPSEAEGYFSSLPLEFRWQLVQELVSKAIDAKPADVQLVSNVFRVAVSNSLVDEAQFSQGFTQEMEYLEDTRIDSPNAYGNIASLLKAANLSQEAVESLADKILVEDEMAITPKEKLLRKYATLT